MGGWAAQVRWQRAGGHGFPVSAPLTPEAIISKWNVITNFGMSTFMVWAPITNFYQMMAVPPTPQTGPRPSNRLAERSLSQG